MTTTPGPEPGIAMWGAPQSGKTTLLAALKIAMLRADGPWNLIGGDGPSTDFLAKVTADLSEHRRFPSGTLTPGQHRFVLVNSDPPSRGRVRGGRQPAAARQIKLDLFDPPGRFYNGSDSPGTLATEDLQKNLRSSRGIAFLYDPTRERTIGDAFTHLDGPLSHLLSWTYNHGRLLRGKLSHHVAICVTKFDDERVLRTAHRLGMLEESASEGAWGQPRVPDLDAREFFSRLCEVSRNENADLMLTSLNKYFRKDRIRYFVSSSIGFYVRGRTFDFDDCCNVRTERGPRNSEVQLIRGQARPINVMEPLLWLGEQIAEDLEEGRR